MSPVLDSLVLRGRLDRHGALRDPHRPGTHGVPRAALLAISTLLLIAAILIFLRRPAAATAWLVAALAFLALGAWTLITRGFTPSHIGIVISGSS